MNHDDVGARGVAQLDGSVRRGREAPGAPRLVAVGSPGGSGPALAPPAGHDPVDRGQVASRARQRLGHALDEPSVDALVAATGGVLSLVDAVLDGADGIGPQPWDRPAVLAAWDPVRRLAGVDAPRLPLLREVVLAMSLGAPPDPGVLADVLRRDPGEVVEALAHVRRSGLLGPDGAVVPAVREAVQAVAPPDRRAIVLGRVIGALEDRGDTPAQIVLRTADVGVHHPGLAAQRIRAARALVEDDPARAARLFADAVTAGADGAALAVDRARSAALAGDVPTALRLADDALAHSTGPRASEAAQVLGAVLTQQGLVGHAAAVYRPLADAGDVAAAQLWSLAALTTGQDAGRRADWPVGTRPPSLVDGAREAMVRGVQQSLDGAGTGALSTLLESAAVLRTRGRAALLPDTPAAVAALVALHAGASGHAVTVLRDALACGLGGPVAQPRHRLLLGWTAMLDGRLDEAREQVALAARAAGDGFGARDELVARALDLGVARRSNDLGGLLEAWPAALDALVQRPVDLFGLLPLGEIAVAAARLGRAPQVAPHLAQATSLLEGLGSPVLWSVPHHWYGIQAALVSERPDRLERHARPLVAAARQSDYAEVLAEAARVWVQVLGARVDPPAVERVARRLVGVGMAWDGGRLVGHAAARTPDRRSMVALLQLARALRPANEEPRAPHRARPVVASGAAAPPLSGRELEVARLVVEGQTYRQIAERLYISPKTVEHHVARMRQRLGLHTRAELLAHLRGLLAQTPAGG
ncbi:helix-turn-helix transcriptional regulator [Cellulomonas soli]|uniref:Helix-turn-helix transcriptional regulator n=1 Tax=Cellulomonas soli TaxID=931535 RepID=A0A512P8I6_9CELL|nr:helix-turn-helix transcriptional regulator [Cellulomonas soli]NYI57730.1 DNA-binding CsgD family transcriptional regulator [Cellulomonas soli]GEP67511.1 helix-turn-helix transcriptional regulator [Cellulomonas soli]